MSEDWISVARLELLRRRARRGGWGYRTNSKPCVEATVLACLAILSIPVGDDTEAGDAVRSSSRWLVSLQRPDGSLGVAPGIPDRGWPTAYALLLWSLLGEEGDCRRRAANWLLAQAGRPIDRGTPGQPSPFGHDPTLVGWPWIDGTHSWLEPTSAAILALTIDGSGEHSRVTEGIRLMLDRALPHGGWNYGNRTVFGTELRPQPAPTGLALTALARARRSDRVPAVDRALSYLEATLSLVHAPISLGWGVLGLRSWESCPPEADAWLARSNELRAGRDDSNVGLSLLLLAIRRGVPFDGSSTFMEGRRS